MNGVVERALGCLGRGFDVTCDYRAKYCKGEERLVVMDEEQRQDLVVPGFGVFPSVSGDVKCDKGERIRFQPDVLEFDKMSELFNQRNSMSGRIPSGLFNAMFGFDGSSWAQDAANTKSLAMDGFFVSLFNLRIDRRSLALSDHIISSVPSSCDPVALARFIANFGTHIIVGLGVGGQDVVYVRQDQSSRLSPSEIKQHLEKLGEELFTGSCAILPLNWKSKEPKLKVSEAFNVFDAKPSIVSSFSTVSRKDVSLFPQIPPAYNNSVSLELSLLLAASELSYLYTSYTRARMTALPLETLFGLFGIYKPVFRCFHFHNFSSHQCSTPSSNRSFKSYWNIKVSSVIDEFGTQFTNQGSRLSSIGIVLN